MGRELASRCVTLGNNKKEETEQEDSEEAGQNQRKLGLGVEDRSKR